MFEQFCVGGGCLSLKGELIRICVQERDRPPAVMGGGEQEPNAGTGTLFGIRSSLG